MKRYITYLLNIFVFVGLMSCASDVDFDQAKNIELNQNFTTSFIYLNVDQNKFLNSDASAEIPILTDISTIDIFDSKYFEDNLVKTTINFQIENSFDRGFDIEFSFLNTDDVEMNSFIVSVPNNSNQIHLQSFEDLDLLSLKFSEKLRITINLQPSSDSSMLMQNTEMKLAIKSFANFIFKIN
ncbi:hypothetical protein [Aureibaculum conchae]|uniref:hypothetical protein n=1 Tax=Aureibaculum sp. 2308TA14-22 TaxID=3108392 RepID=UPI0033948CEA